MIPFYKPPWLAFKMRSESDSFLLWVAFLGAKLEQVSSNPCPKKDAPNLMSKEAWYSFYEQNPQPESRISTRYCILSKEFYGHLVI